MKIVLNRSGILWAVGLLQPVSAHELSNYLQSVLADAGETPSGADLHRFLLDSTRMEHVVRVSRDPDLFSLSLAGNAYLTERQRKSRDVSRIFLLKDSWASRFYASRENADVGLGDEASPVDISSPLKGSEANTVGLSVPRLRPYWPRYSKQLVFETGLSRHSRDTSLKYLSFESDTQIAVALKRPIAPAVFDLVTIGLTLGISPRLVQRTIRNKERNYRSFTVAKRNGGRRTIESPRVFLKVIQKFIADYVISNLQIHPSVHSYQNKKSIITNANAHVGKRFVANVDIKNFFGSITEKFVISLLVENSFDVHSAYLISAILTKNGILPQGAPSSPLISNAILHSFDSKIHNHCIRLGMSYSRYADDITVSGNNKEAIQQTITLIKKELADGYGFSLNDTKSRLATSAGQQSVTGIVVNEYVQPSRKFRRNMRAAAHNIVSGKVKSAEKINHALGGLNYLTSFEHIQSLGNFDSLKRQVMAVRSDEKLI